jgi:hypothetical protein
MSGEKFLSEVLIMTERQYFLDNVTMLYDTREKQNFDLLKEFAHMGVKIRQETFKSADYSFYIDGADYRSEWLGERKGSLAELYGNVMASNKADNNLRNNLEEECERIKSAGVTEFILFLEGCRNLSEIKHYIMPKATKQGKNAGKHLYSTLLSWSCNNRYGFKIVCALSQSELAVEMVNMAYYFWRNKMKQQYGDNFLGYLSEGENGRKRN